MPAARLLTRKFLLDGGIILWQEDREGKMTVQHVCQQFLGFKLLEAFLRWLI